MDQLSGYAARVRSLVASALCAVLVSASGCRRRVAPECGRAVPEAELWAVKTDAQLAGEISTAMRCGRARGSKVLLEFTADWCPDCRVMTDLERQGEAAAVLRERYERVRVHVGHWDRHAELRARYGVQSIATYVVLDANTGARVAQTTVEPVTGGRGPMTPALWAAWLRAPTTAAGPGAGASAR